MLALSPYQFSDRLFFVCFGLLANMLLLGVLEFSFFRNLLRQTMQRLERKLNKETRSSKNRQARGAIVLIVALFLCGMIAMSLSALTATHYLGWIAEMLFLGIFIPARQVYIKVGALSNVSDLAVSRPAISRLAPRDTHLLDEYGLRRTLLEYLANSLADKILSPILWYILLGLPGFVASRIITETAWLLGHASPRHHAYGLTTIKLEHVINAIPAFLAAWLIVLATLFVPKTAYLGALKGRFKKTVLTTPQKATCIATIGGAVNSSLGGPRNVQGHFIDDPWTSHASAKTSPGQLARGRMIYGIACLCLLFCLAFILLLTSRT